MTLWEKDDLMLEKKWSFLYSGREYKASLPKRFDLGILQRFDALQVQRLDNN